jgi:hypothetical protein
MNCSKKNLHVDAERKTPSNEISLETDTNIAPDPNTKDETFVRHCRCCGCTEGLYPYDDICSSCDVSYYS